MSSLSEYLAEDFEAKVRARGEAYARSGAVHGLVFNGNGFAAQVRGQDTYQVKFQIDGEDALCDCTCPHIGHWGTPCKHVWALIRIAETRPEAHPFIKKVISNESMLFAEGEPVEDWDDNDETEDDIIVHRAKPAAHPVSNASKQPPQATWRMLFEKLSSSPSEEPYNYQRLEWEKGREACYVIDLADVLLTGKIRLEFGGRTRKQNGEWAKIRPLRLSRGLVEKIDNPEDRVIASSLLGAEIPYQYGRMEIGPFFILSTPQIQELLPRIAEKGSLFFRKNSNTDPEPCAWDAGEPWRLEFSATESPEQEFILAADLQRGGEVMPLSEPLLIHAEGFFIARGKFFRFIPNGNFEWVSLLRKTGRLVVPRKDRLEFAKSLAAGGNNPRVALPEELTFRSESPTPRFGASVKKPKRPDHYLKNRLVVELFFEYPCGRVAENTPEKSFVNEKERTVIQRNIAAEAAAAERVLPFGAKIRHDYWSNSHARSIPEKKLPLFVRALVAENWIVEAEGSLYRSAGNFRMAVTSGIDWFDLEGGVDFDGHEAPLPAIIEAIRRKETMVRLDDGTFGVLPEEWLRKYAPLVGLGDAGGEGNAMRFKRSQAALLDALLAAEPLATCDEVFRKIRGELASFKGVKPEKEPKEFRGALRNYQREALGWFEFLRRFAFGGCLADDMGLGKTVVVLALLAERRNGKKERALPSLAVVPKSLIFNWREEAKRFTPKLRVLDFVGLERHDKAEELDEHDLVITTYGTLRNDIAKLKDMEFDYVILDEAQAVKNANSVSAKAVRLLKGRHRLALSGTPIENHLGELWSLFEFLNPGMLGTASVFKNIGANAASDERGREILAKAVRPFVLRRTKEKVLSDLPKKTEQTLYCELDADQRRIYDEIRDHYRRSLLGRIEKEGLAKSKMHVLEALLRLRQAACHPELLDGKERKPPRCGAKLELLLEQLEETIGENHKTLVFSQFTSFLAILRRELDRRNISYEYLDGKTSDRQARVERFQNDPKLKLFLISLKAGGVGLNLTAADYVFLLDPWWNPAVEAQAMDRAHRIGQTKPVFAYRVIAKDTVEEKVLELQKEKKALADSIISEDASLLKSLKREDLEILLS